MKHSNRCRENFLRAFSDKTRQVSIQSLRKRNVCLEKSDKGAILLKYYEKMISSFDFSTLPNKKMCPF